MRPPNWWLEPRRQRQPGPPPSRPVRRRRESCGAKGHSTLRGQWRRPDVAHRTLADALHRLFACAVGVGAVVPGQGAPSLPCPRLRSRRTHTFSQTPSILPALRAQSMVLPVPGIATTREHRQLVVIASLVHAAHMRQQCRQLVPLLLARTRFGVHVADGPTAAPNGEHVAAVVRHVGSMQRRLIPRGPRSTSRCRALAVTPGVVVGPVHRPVRQSASHHHEPVHNHVLQRYNARRSPTRASGDVG